MTVIVIQLLNGVQLGVMLFLMASGLTLVFGLMNFINLAHGSFYMIGAFIASSAVMLTGDFLSGLVVAVLGTGLVGLALELGLLRYLYQKSHLQQVLITFGLILVLNELARIVWGPFPVALQIPAFLSGSVEILPGETYPVYRLAILAVGLVVALGLYLIITRTRAGMWVRAGASDRDMASAMGVNVQLVFALLFGFGAALAGLAGVMAGPILTVQVGMGEPILILSLVVTVIGGIGSVRGAFIAALSVGIVDTFGRVLLPPALGSMIIFVFMALFLAYRPQGLFASGR
ncbi:MAG: branched-chain amino acid ABC transporter permease [Xanthobacteraceae bacterium]